MDTKAAVPKGEHHGVRGGGGGGFKPQVEKVDKVFLGGLSINTTDEDIKVALGYDKVTDVNIMKEANGGKSRGFGFATFKSCEDVEEILMGRTSVHIKVKVRSDVCACVMCVHVLCVYMCYVCACVMCVRVVCVMCVHVLSASES